MKKIIFVFLCFLFSLGMFSQNLSSISGSSFGTFGAVNTYVIWFESPLKVTTTIVIKSNCGKFDSQSGSNIKKLSVDSGQSYFSVNIYWPDGYASDGTITAYREEDPSRIVELTGIKLGSSSSTSKLPIPNPEFAKDLMETGETFALGYKSGGYAFKIIDYSYDSGLLEMEVV